MRSGEMILYFDRCPIFLPYCSAIWVLKMRRNWYKSLHTTQKADLIVVRAIREREQAFLR